MDFPPPHFNFIPSSATLPLQKEWLSVLNHELVKCLILKQVLCLCLLLLPFKIKADWLCGGGKRLDGSKKINC